MSDTIHRIPLAEIDDAALPRDRTGLDPEPLRELRDSILASGLRMPVELYPLSRPHGPFRYGIVSGFRRVTACREIHAYLGADAWATIPAFLREPADLAAALAAMVEENQIRTNLSPWEQGRIAVIARDHGLYPTIEEAVDRLYPAAAPMKRSRLRALARTAEVLDGALTAPERLSERRALRLADAVRKGFAEIIEAALRQSKLKDPDSQWQLMLPYLIESEQARDSEPAPDPATPASRRRPRRLSRPRANLVIRRELTREGWCLHFTGREASSALMDRVFDEIDLIFTPSR